MKKNLTIILLLIGIVIINLSALHEQYNKQSMPKETPEQLEYLEKWDHNQQGKVYGYDLEKHLKSPKVLLLSSEIEDAEILANAALDNVLVIEYNMHKTTLNQLLQKTTEALEGRKASSIAIAAHNYGKNKFHLTKSELISVHSTILNANQKKFWKSLASMIVDNGRIDLLPCNIAEGNEGGLLISLLESEIEINFTASIDKTGNYYAGGNWILETDNIDLSNEYFNIDNLLSFSETLWNQQDKVWATPGGNLNSFGAAVAIYGDYAVVGAHWAPTGGLAYIFKRNEYNNWIQEAILSASDASLNDHFGYSVSIYEDYAVIGAVGDNSETGSVYIFKKPTSGWTDMTETQKLTASDGQEEDFFGAEVSIYGNYAFIGSDLAGSNSLGSVYIYKLSGASWGQEANLSRPVGATRFGSSISLSGDMAIIIGGGSAYVFERIDQNWSQQAVLSAADGSNGSSVSISGDCIIMGADGGNFNLGSAYVFEKPSGVWTNMTETAILTASDELAGDRFGASVSISGDHVIIGAPGDNSDEGAAYIYSKPPYGWYNMTETKKIGRTHEEGFGASVAMSGNYAIIGAPLDTDEKGSAYIFYNDPSTLYEYRTARGGDWSNVVSGLEVWERRLSGSSNYWETVTNSDNLPDYEDEDITILHAVNITENLIIDQAEIVDIDVFNGILTIENGVTLTINNGEGDDLIVNGILTNNNLNSTCSNNGSIINNGTITFFNLINNTNASIDIYATKEMTIENNLTNNENATISIRSNENGTGSLITIGNSINEGDFIVESYISEGMWHLISSPIEDATANTFNGNYLQFWTEDGQSWTDIEETSTELIPVQGYSFWGNGKGSTYLFNGIPNNGTQSFTLSYHENTNSGKTADGLNLIGNPYPSSIDWAGLTGTYGFAYIWDPLADEGAGDYLEWNSGEIAPMQGFFIYTNTDGSSFTLNNSNRTHGGTFYKRSVNDNYLVLFGSNGVYKDEISICFNNEATEGFYLTEDAWKIKSNGDGITQIWTSSSDGNLAYDTRPETEFIELGFKNNQNGFYSIGLTEFANIPEVHLEDSKTNNFHNLRKSDYSFIWNSESDSENRFKLHFNSVGIEESNIAQNNIQVHASGQQIFVKSSEELEIIITDLLGRVIINQSLSGDGVLTLPANSDSGVYMVKATSGQNTTCKKVFINK